MLADEDRMSVGEKVASSEDCHTTGHDIVAPASSRRSVFRKSNMSVRSLHCPTSPTMPTPSINLSPSASHDRPASWKSQDARSSSSSILPSLERADSLAKKLRMRGSRLFKRQHSKTNPSSLRTLYWVTDSQVGLDRSLEQWATLHRVSQHGRMHSTGNIGLRPQISEPYNFQHLTHTKANQFQKLEEASHSELASEFSAIRASQTPQQELQGIKVESLQNRNLSSELLPTEPSCSDNGPQKATPPKRPRRPQPHQLHITSANIRSPLSPRSIENFSQPSPRSYISTPNPLTPPPRVSSRRSTTDILVGLHKSPIPLSPQPVAGETPAGAPSGDLAASPTAYMTEEWDDELFDYTTAPHAVTTPDETALTLKPLSFGPSRTELPNVPEEDEAALGRNDSPETAAEFVEAKSFSSLKSCSVRWSSSSSRASAVSPVSPLSEDFPFSELVVPLVGQPFDDVPLHSRLSCRFSVAPNEIDHCWEDDIDYCYEHAAEADCEFDWDRSSVEDGKLGFKGDMDGSNLEPAREVARYSKMLINDVRAPSSENAPVNLSFSDLTSLDMSIPDLDPSSRHSTKSSTVSLGCPVTPSCSHSSNPYMFMPLDLSKADGVAPVSGSSSTHVSLESQLDPGVMCHKLLAVDHTPGLHGLDDGSYDNPKPRGAFQRSNHGPIGKSNSQESFFQAPSATSAGRHHDNIAVASLPDLFASFDGAQQRNVVREAVVESPALDATGMVMGIQSRLPLRPRRGRTFARGIACPPVLQARTDFSRVLSQPEKPLPLAPPHSQPEKPLPSPPRPAPLSDTETRLLGQLLSPPKDSNNSDTSPSDSHSITPAANPIVDSAPFGFFPSVPLALSS